MKKLLKILIFLFLLIIGFLIFLSTIGLETSKLNTHIQKIVKNLDSEIEIDLKKVKLLLDPINLKINAKTIGSNLRIGDTIIETENIRTNISINSFLKNDFSIENLFISTKSVQIKDLISFVRKIRNTPELYLLEKKLRKGFLIFDLDLEFNNDGTVKDNFKLTGFIKDTKLKISKKYNLEKINLIFDLNSNSYQFKEIRFNLDNIPLTSEKITIKKINNNFLIEGDMENKKFLFDKKILDKFFPKFDFNNINLSSKNIFSFLIHNKFQIKDLKISSKVKFNDFKFKHNSNLKEFFPNIKNEINLSNHMFDLNYDKKNLIINGNGNIFLQNNKDFIIYKIIKKDKNLKFETNLNVEQNPILINLLGFEKKLGSNAKISLKGTYYLGKKIFIKNFTLNEDRNYISVDDLTLDNNLKFLNFKKINLDYLDRDLRENNLTLINEKEIINVVGTKFNANSLIEDLINGEKSKKTKINEKLNLKIKIDQVFLDKDHIVNNLIGKIEFKNDEILNANLNANFSKSKKLKFTVNSNQNEKVTTLYLDEAEPLVKRYRFIKGFRNGSLDFYSSKKGINTISNLKIYDFKLKELPILTKILTLASLQGIADILSGEGITFDEFEMNFSNENMLIKIDEMYAIGPAISILMDGYIEKNELVSLRGSLVPATTINKAIGTIPILGKILVGSKTGEGVFGVSFKIKGPPKNLETNVNPIKTLTPRFITRTLEKIKKY